MKLDVNAEMEIRIDRSSSPRAPLRVERILALCLLFLLASATVEASAQSPLPLHEIRAATYTKAFAERFGLSAPSPGSELVGGLQAVEFMVEPGPRDPTIYMCSLAVYLDNTLRIAYPEGEAGARSMPSQQSLLVNPTRDQWNRWSEADKNRFNERSSRYRRMAFVASPDFVWETSGWGFSVVLEEYHRNLFPGLSYLKVNIGCPAGRSIGQKKEVQLWLKREGAKDYARVIKPDANDFFRFAFPQSFVDRILPLLTLADQRSRKQRELGIDERK